MNYENSIEVRTDIRAAFKAASGEIEKWWGKVDSPISKVGDSFSISFGETVWKFLITEFSPNDKILWKCIEADHYLEGVNGVKEEWLNTEIHWNFTNKGDFVEISVLHNGLTPELNCYDNCKAGWNFFITTSLKNYLEKGRGNPHFVE